MKINTNSWNKIRYTLYTPFYDLVGKVFSQSRKKSIGRLTIEPGDEVLLVGAGTGLDIEYIDPQATITATDITPSMIRRIQQRYPNARSMVMDGHNLQFEDDSFDFIILHLIIAVIPDPHRCIAEVQRVLKPGGKVAVFDKFVSGERVSLKRKILNNITTALFSDITRDLESIIKDTSLIIEHYEEANFGGNFKIITLLNNQDANYSR